MFDSKVKASEFVARLKNEVDAAPDIDNDTYLGLIDDVEQTMYSEIIKEIHTCKPTVTESTHIKMPYDAEEGDLIRFEDVREVYAGDIQLIKTTATGWKFPDSYYKLGDDLYLNLKDKSKSSEITIYYYIRPKLKRGTTGEDTIKLPPERIPLIGAKVRGEALKLVNEDATAAKWLSDYNVMIEQFREFMTFNRAELRASMEA